MNYKVQRYLHTNASKLAVGEMMTLNPAKDVAQRELVEPKNFILSQNTEHIGIHRPGRLGTDYFQHQITHPTEFATVQKVMIYESTPNHMHYHPVENRTHWSMLFIHNRFVRSNAMLWGLCTDNAYRTWGDKDPLPYASANDVKREAERNGFEYDIVYTNQRYHQNKSYSDNFTFIKDTIGDVDDEEKVVYELMNKLV